MSEILKGKNALVTGAAVGIGGAYAHALAKQGANVSVCDIRPDIINLPGALKEASAHNIDAFAQVADVRRAQDIRSFVQATIEQLGSIDILINNAGVCLHSIADDPLDKSIRDYNDMVGTNLRGEYLMGRAVIAQMLKQGTGGEIVNIATDHMVTCGSPFEVCPGNDTCPWKQAPRPTGGGANMDLYDASKWALNGLLFSWAKALGPHNIRVNAFCMGATDSWMIRDWYGFPQLSDDETPAQSKEVATWMAKEDVAQVMIDLLEEGPGGRTAQNINLCVGRRPQLESAHEHLYISDEALHAKT